MQQLWIAVKGCAREGCKRMSRGSGLDLGLDVGRSNPVKTLRGICWYGKGQICRSTWRVRSSHVQLVASRFESIRDDKQHAAPM
jgi:hypothetical protein